MPGQWYLTSAVVLLALSFERPAIVPSWGGSAEVGGDAAFVYEQNDQESLIRAMVAARDSDGATLKARAGALGKMLSWKHHARLLCQAYEQAMTGGPRG
jgi:glycosyltransferase involved in cell wall biosynthesis